MKKNRIVLALMSFVIVVSVALVACENGTSGSSSHYDGRWLDISKISEGYTDYSFTFSGNNFVFRKAHLHDSSKNGVYAGTFTFTDTYFTWTPAQGESWPGFSQTYTMYGINQQQLALGVPPQGVRPPWGGGDFSPSGYFSKQ